MAKTLNQFLEGYLKVKNPDEQKFVDKHVVAKHSDRNGNGDDVFKASKVKMDDRRKTRHGYNPGEDEKVYEALETERVKHPVGKRPAGKGWVLKQAGEQTGKDHSVWERKFKKVNEELKGNQHKLDHNKNGKIDSHDFHLLRKKKKVAEEAEQIDELSTDTMKRYQDKARTSADALRDKGFRGNAPAWKKAQNRSDSIDRAQSKIKARSTNEEAEQIDELSTGTLQSYRKKARAQGNAIVDKMKMGGGDWSKDQKDTKTLRKRASGAQMSGKMLRKRGESLKTEETEQLDELSPSTMGAYTKKAAADFKARKPKMGYDGQLKKMQNRKVGVDRALKKMYGEEAEQIDELSKKTLATYAIKAKNQMGRDEYRSGVRMGARNGRGKEDEMEKAHQRRAEKRSKGIDNALDRLAKEEVELGEKLDMNKASMGTVVKDFQKSDAPQFKGKSQDKRRQMAIAAKLTAERGGKPLRKEEKLAELLGDLTESHRRTMLFVFDKLNEDNQKKFLEACETEEGIDAMLDFSIGHRGE